MAYGRFRSKAIHGRCVGLKEKPGGDRRGMETSDEELAMIVIQTGLNC
jgi:hypothetical protein